MAREILPESTVQQTPATPEPTSAGVPVGAVPLVAPFGNEDHRDALAGAFPAWDLVPAIPFVRRVK